METGPKTVRLAGSTQTCPCHVCAFFRTKEEEDAVLLPFMAEGFEAGDKLVNIIDERNREERLQRLASAGIDVHTAERTGQLDIKPWERAHVVADGLTSTRCLRDSKKRQRALAVPIG